MSRVVILVLAVLAFFWLLRRALGSRKREDEREKRAADPGTPGEDAAPELVACARCSVLVPKNLAFVEEGAAPPQAARLFCSEEHRRLGLG